MLAARDAQGSGAQEAIAKLCSTYWFPLYAFVRRQGSNPQEAEDFTQEFFLHFLDRNPLANVERAGGKFRSFLLVCLKNFLAHERERARAQRRGGGQPLIPLEGGDTATRDWMDAGHNRPSHRLRVRD